MPIKLLTITLVAAALTGVPVRESTAATTTEKLADDIRYLRRWSSPLSDQSSPFPVAISQGMCNAFALKDSLPHKYRFDSLYDHPLGYASLFIGESNIAIVTILEGLCATAGSGRSAASAMAEPKKLMAEAFKHLETNSRHESEKLGREAADMRLLGSFLGSMIIWKVRGRSSQSPPLVWTP